ncbi:MAG: flagellar basal body P-ring protein FlgI [Planctomycetota bacterium]
MTHHQDMSRHPRRLARVLLSAVALLGAVVVHSGCTGSDGRQRPRSVTPVIRDTPAALRGTIGAQASITGLERTLVSGYGLVVGLNGTGGGILDERIAVTMERLMGLQGIGKANEYSGTALVDPLTGEGRTPAQLLRDPDVAVVAVQAAVPPGAPDGYEFDVYVAAVNATSLEGGKLWTTDLRLGPPAVFGGKQTRKIAEAWGEIFINPFSEPGAESSGIVATRGRVLGGGKVTGPLEILITLDNASMTRARLMVSSINSRFPEGPGDDGPTARGRNSSTITVNIPRSYRDRPGEFINVLRNLPVDRSFPQETSRRLARAMASDSQLAARLGWALVGMGDAALPFLREHYRSPERSTREAALRAGSVLGDPLALDPLTEEARGAQTSLRRAEAISQLGDLRGGPEIDIILQSFLEESELQIRIAAYETLATRAERFQLARLIRSSDPRLLLEPGALDVLEDNAETFLAGDNPQYLTRIEASNSFLLDRLPGGEPLVYITQQGRPRIVILGDRPELDGPLLIQTWSNRLMLSSETASGPVRLFYRPIDSRSPIVLEELPKQLEDLTLLMAHEPSPEDPRPGLGLTYSEVVGALYAIHSAEGTTAAFATERDRLLAALIEATERRTAEERPEFEGGPIPEITGPGLELRIDDETTAPLPSAGTPSLVVPIERGPRRSGSGQ